MQIPDSSERAHQTRTFEISLYSRLNEILLNHWEFCLSCFLRIFGIQQIAVIEKRRSYFDKQARENLRCASGSDRRSENFKKVQGLQNSSKVENKIDVRAKLAKLAGVSTDIHTGIVTKTSPTRNVGLVSSYIII